MYVRSIRFATGWIGNSLYLNVFDFANNSKRQDRKISQEGLTVKVDAIITTYIKLFE